LGAHAKAPSILAIQNGNIPLNLFLHQNPTEHLGASVANLYGTLPY
jgi:mannose-6-phosphate isomerase class I